MLGEKIFNFIKLSIFQSNLSVKYNLNLMENNNKAIYSRDSSPGFASVFTFVLKS